VGKVWEDKRGSNTMDGWDPVYAARSEKAVIEMTQQEKIDSGLVRPYSKTSDRMIIEDIEKGFSIEKIAKIYNRDADDLRKHIKKITVKSNRCKGEDSNFETIYAAIFKQAAKDDISTVKSMIYTELHNRGEDKKEIHKFIDENRDVIEKCVNESIMKEAEKYPETTKTNATGNLYRIRNKFVKKAVNAWTISSKC
jgi:hypothetical protein